MSADVCAEKLGGRPTRMLLAISSATRFFREATSDCRVFRALCLAVDLRHGHVTRREGQTGGRGAGRQRASRLVSTSGRPATGD